MIPWLSDRTGRRSPFLLGLSAFFITGAVILVAAPGIAYAGALLAGVAQGGLFALVMTLPLDFERTPAKVGALVAMMLGLGYTIAATSPFILGAIRDVTGSFDAVLWVAAAFLMAQFFALARAHAHAPVGDDRLSLDPPFCAGVASRRACQAAPRPGGHRFLGFWRTPPGRCAPCGDGAPQATGLRGPIPTRPDDPDERLASTQNGGSRLRARPSSGDRLSRS